MPSTGVIGRDAELAELDARVRENRLVTVVGPGGVGKTALAGAAADALADRFPMGVRRVDLTRVDDPGAVAGTLAAQLGFDSFDALLCAPGEHPLLLVVDNCEHVLDTVADVVASLLGACTQPSVIATSRAPLELPGESVVALAPLTVPTDAEPESGPAVELFLCRSRDAGSSAAGEDPLAVARLCRQLDGLPLALEIAAARTRTMTVAEISERLTERIDVLQRPRFRGDPRHRSLADTIAWSYDLLPDDDRHGTDGIGKVLAALPAGDGSPPVFVRKTPPLPFGDAHLRVRQRRDEALIVRPSRRRRTGGSAPRARA